MLSPRHSSAATRLMTRLGLLAAACTLGFGSIAGAGGFLDNGVGSRPERPTYATPAARRPVEGEDTGALQAELYNASLAVHEARQNVEKTRSEFTRARTRNYPRGAGLEALHSQLERMQQQQKQAEDEFLEVFQRARNGDVPAGVLAEYWDLEEEISNAR